MTKLADRKTKLTLEVIFDAEPRRPMVVAVEEWGLRLRPKGRQYHYEIGWAQIWNRAATIEADRKREEKKAAKNAKR